MLDEVQAMMRGAQRGNQEFQGMMPSAANMGGGAAPADPLKPKFDQAHQTLMSLAADLHRDGDEVNANKIVKYATDVATISLARRKERAKQAADQASGQGAGVNAMGAPGGY